MSGPAPRPTGGGLIQVEDQLATVLDAVRPLPVEHVAVTDGSGRTLARPAVATLPIPAFRNSAMDGFAVRFDDVAEAGERTPVRLRVVADLPAGDASDPPIDAGEAVRIMTGSPVPSAADTIVPFEDTVDGLAESLVTAVVLRAPSARGVWVRDRGADLPVGAMVLEAGVELGPRQLAAAVAGGIASLAVAARPRVAVISTGSELVAPGDPVGAGMIPDSNAPLLDGLVRETGAETVLVERVRDDADALLAALARATGRRADVVVLSGGVSEGAYDVVRRTLGDGADGDHRALDVVRVAMQPGKPQAFGRLPGGALVFGLPGNPVSVAVSFEVFVRPALLALQGRTVIHRPVLRLPAATGWRTPPGRRQYLPAVIDRDEPGAWRVRPAAAGGSGSHLTGSLARAEAYAIVPADVEAVAAGDPVDVMLVS